MAEDESGPGADRGAAHLASLAAPAIALLTGLMFLTGWSYNFNLSSSFGLNPNGFEEPLQITIAKGYLAIVLVLFLALLGLGWFKFIAWSGKRAAKSGTKASAAPPSWPTVNFSALTRSLAFWACICGLLIGGALVGGTIGASAGYMARRIVDGGCNDTCVYVLVGETEHHGMIVIQDPNRAAIYSRGGLILVKADDIRRVSFRSNPVPPQPAPPQPRPK